MDLKEKIIQEVTAQINYELDNYTFEELANYYFCKEYDFRLRQAMNELYDEEA